jgi:hypothetical protein
MASEQRSADDLRIHTATRRLVIGSLAATVAFGGLAATATHHTSASTPAQAQTQVQVQQSFSPPVAQSGGS